MNKGRAMTVRQLGVQVAEANHRLTSQRPVALSFGNAGGLDKDAGVLVIKPSGLACDLVTRRTPSSCR